MGPSRFSRTEILSSRCSSPVAPASMLSSERRRLNHNHEPRATARTEILSQRICRQALLTIMSYFVFLHSLVLVVQLRRLQFVVIAKEFQLCGSGYASCVTQIVSLLSP